MVSALYAVLGALLLMKFSFNVVRLRMQYRVAYGDGGFSELQSAIRIHGNAVEYIPVALVLLLFMGILDDGGTDDLRGHLPHHGPRSRKGEHPWGEHLAINRPVLTRAPDCASGDCLNVNSV